MMAEQQLIGTVRPPTSTNMDPEVRQFVISQLLVIALPVGTLLERKTDVFGYVAPRL